MRAIAGDDHVAMPPVLNVVQWLASPLGNPGQLLIRSSVRIPFEFRSNSKPEPEMAFRVAKECWNAVIL